MPGKVKEIGGLSRKAKFNIFIGVFLVFIIISALASLSQISNILRSREKITELEEKLISKRQENIKLLAEEKSLYQDEAIELEARKQFNMAKEGETNYFIDIETAQNLSGEESEESSLSQGENEMNSGSGSGKYTEQDLWGNIRLLYETEIREN
jgi:cell division protein FtsB